MKSPEIYNPIEEKRRRKKPVTVDEMGVHITDLDEKEEQEKQPEAWREQK